MIYPSIVTVPEYSVEIKVGVQQWFWSLLYRGTVYATGRKGYTVKTSAKKAFENMFGVELVTEQYFGRGSYRETYRIKIKEEK